MPLTLSKVGVESKRISVKFSKSNLVRGEASAFLAQGLLLAEQLADNSL